MTPLKLSGNMTTIDIERETGEAKVDAQFWMSRYYRQTERLLRAERALRDIVQILEKIKQADL